MTRVLVFLAVLALGSCPARADEGTLVELEAGDPAPFKGSLCDLTCAAEILHRREKAEAEVKDLKLSLQKSQASEAEAVKTADGRVSWGVLLGATGTALVVGTILGVVLVATAK